MSVPFPLPRAGRLRGPRSGTLSGPLSGLAGAMVPLAVLPAAVSPTVVAADFDPATAFVPPAAVSYAQDLVPYGARVRVTVVRGAGRTTVAVALASVAPDHTFPAHVHTGRCGADPAASGPHYQHQVDPVQPSSDPAFANERNELRMQVRTDATGAGQARTTVGWEFRPNSAHSVVLHAGEAAAGHAAGDRVACVNVDF
ncbi:superoxide dismutase family protein [Kitasatospora sp. NPDC094015]|uniref:superoxide dismutase family protein n=1 Tax=Kitasatospora sp. NPDC094015 TaxID=3155205 RepID=UPI003330EB60